MTAPEAADSWFVKVGADVFGPYPTKRLCGFVIEGRVRPSTLIGASRDGVFSPAARIDTFRPWLDRAATVDDAARTEPEPAVETHAAPEPKPAPKPAPAAEPAIEPVRPAPERVARETAAARAILSEDFSSRSARRTPETRPERSAERRPEPRPETRAEHRAEPVDDTPLIDPTVSVSAPPEARIAAGPVHTVWVHAVVGGLRDADARDMVANFGEAIEVAGGLWHVRTRATASAIRNALSRLMAEGDTLVVIDASKDDAAWFNIGLEVDRTLRATRIAAEKARDS